MNGIISDFSYQAGSGIYKVIVHGDAGPLLRGLNDCFGSLDGAIGANIEYKMTDFSTIAFVPTN